MGNYMGYGSAEREDSAPGKRKRDDKEDELESEDLEELKLETPKRKKMKNTAEYIYETLFLHGENSDIRIIALGREWPLHKIYLCQSGFFSSMFSGSWKESNLSEVTLNIPDDNIDEEALQIAFGSLYRDDVLIKPSRVVSVLAAASLLQLDGLIQQCADIMKETISSKTVCSYHQAAMMYGQGEVTNRCLDWLEKNLMAQQSIPLLKELSVDLMEKLVRSPSLFVMQVEMDVYTMLKKWSFLKLHPDWNLPIKQLMSETDQYFIGRNTDTADPVSFFLESGEGRQFVSVFQNIRLKHIINDLMSTKVISRDKIIPIGWMLPVFQQQWLAMLCIEQDTNQSALNDISEVDFNRHCMRCGRKLPKDGEYCWRWTGFNYGLDLLVTYTNGLLFLRRNTTNRPCATSVSLQAQRQVFARVSVVSYDTSGELKYEKHTKMTKLSLGKDEETLLMTVDRQATFPLHVSVNFLYVPPPPSQSGTSQTKDPPSPVANQDRHVEGSL
ncbi:Germ cell-less protein-like 1 [Branchiostoma belcheri]|nr:Germ cell-less protein-like 1 [Branchiostoma belcheri]